MAWALLIGKRELWIVDALGYPHKCNTMTDSLDSGHKIYDNTLSTNNDVKQLYIVRRFFSTKFANLIKIKLEFEPKYSLVIPNQFKNNWYKPAIDTNFMFVSSIKNEHF